MTTSLDLIINAITFGSIEDVAISTILEGLRDADDLYFNDESPLDDVQYDTLKLYANRLAPSDVYFTGIGSSIRGGKVKLPHTMGSLNQIYERDYTKWVEKHSLQNEKIVISDKLDGASAMLVYGKDGNLQIAFSRGDGINGSDTSRHVSKIHNVPKQINTNGNTMTIRGEVIITPHNFEKIKNKVKSKSGRIYRNPRNFISGRMNASDGQDIVYSHIDFVAYEIVESSLSKIEQISVLRNNKFKVVKYFTAQAGELDDDLLTGLLNNSRALSEYEIDGLVLEVDAATVRAHIKPTTNTLNPEFSVKYKVADTSNYAEPTVTHVELNISKDGYIKPVIVFTPVDLVGVTVSRCTGFNMKFIYDNKIGPGVKIKVTRSGDVIPLILGVVS